MSESTISIDACGRPCPEPVVMVKKAGENPDLHEITVRVDNEAAMDNITRFAGYSGWSVANTLVDGPHYIITIRRPAAGASTVEPRQERTDLPAERDRPESGGRLTENRQKADSASSSGSAAAKGQYGLCTSIFIASDKIGSGDDGLGQLLMRGFLFSIREMETAPENLVLMNGGVRLACTGSRSLEHLQRLEAAGMRILVCGTCLDFFNLKAELAAGTISNMQEIAQVLSRGVVLRI